MAALPVPEDGELSAIQLAFEDADQVQPAPVLREPTIPQSADPPLVPVKPAG